MARIAGVDLPREKRVEIGLTYIYGIGRKTSLAILEKAGINPDTRVKDLSENDIAAIRKELEANYVVEGELRKDVALDIKRLKEIETILHSSAGLYASEKCSEEKLEKVLVQMKALGRI